MAERDDDGAGAEVRRKIAELNRTLDKVERKRRPAWVRPALMWIAGVLLLWPLAGVALYRVVDAPTTLLMVSRSFEGQKVRHRAVPLERISPHLVRAVIAAEDSGFCAHDGFEVEAIKAALENNEKGGRLRGASTISQQTAKNLFLWPERSWVRKGLEAYYTVLIEAAWPKKRILEAYLNVAEWGDGYFGIEAAAQGRFGVSAADLTPGQAARLAAVLPSPNKWSADKPGPYVRRRSATIEARVKAIRAQGLDACVIEGAAPAPQIAKPKRGEPEAPAPKPLPPIEPIPDELLSSIEESIAVPEPAAAELASPELLPVGAESAESPDAAAPAPESEAPEAPPGR